MSQSTFGSDIFDGDEPAGETTRGVEEAQDTHNIQQISLRTKTSKTSDADDLGVSFEQEEPEQEPETAAAPETRPEPEPRPEPRSEPRREPLPEPEAEAEAEPEAEAEAEPEAEAEETEDVPVEIPSAGPAEEPSTPASTRRRSGRPRGERRERGDRPPRGERRDRGERSERSEPGRRRRRVGRSDESRSAAPERDRAISAAAPRGPTTSTTGQRIAILLDVWELLAQAKELDGELAFSRLLRRIGGHRTTIRAVAYVTEPERRLMGSLRDSGLEVVEVEAGPGAAVQIAVDAMAIAARVDCVVLAPAQAALAPLATVLRSQGVRVETASFRDDVEGGFPSQQHVTLGEDSLFQP